MIDLKLTLKDAKGKKVYGYLKPEQKETVKKTVTELFKNGDLKELYDKWYEVKEAGLKLYQDKVPSVEKNFDCRRKVLQSKTTDQREDITKIKDFINIKNMVIRESMKIDISNSHILVGEDGIEEYGKEKLFKDYN